MPKIKATKPRKDTSGPAVLAAHKALNAKARRRQEAQEQRAQDILATVSKNPESVTLYPDMPPLFAKSLDEAQRKQNASMDFAKVYLGADFPQPGYGAGYARVSTLTLTNGGSSWVEPITPDGVYGGIPRDNSLHLLQPGGGLKIIPESPEMMAARLNTEAVAKSVGLNPCRDKEGGKPLYPLSGVQRDTMTPDQVALQAAREEVMRKNAEVMDSGWRVVPSTERHRRLPDQDALYADGPDWNREAWDRATNRLAHQDARDALEYALFPNDLRNAMTPTPTPTPKAESDASVDILQEALGIVTGPRRVQYGNAEDNLTCIADLWNTYLSRKLRQPIKLDGIDAAHMMTLLKIAREANSRQHDNLLDAIGYQACAARCVAADNAKSKSC